MTCYISIIDSGIFIRCQLAILVFHCCDIIHTVLYNLITINSDVVFMAQIFDSMYGDIVLLSIAFVFTEHNVNFTYDHYR
jgi:hypothetical protein